MVGLGDSVVRFLWFVDHDDRRSFPGVVSCVKAKVQQVREVVWAGRMGPF